MNKKHAFLQITLTLFLTAAGVAPGLIWFRDAEMTRFIIIVGLGGFIGFCLSLPGVSGGRIFGALAETAVRDAPQQVRDIVADEVHGHSGHKDYKQIKEKMAARYQADDTVKNSVISDESDASN